MSQKNKKQLRRRQFLALMGSSSFFAATNPFELFLQNMSYGLVSQAFAQEIGPAPRRFVHIHDHGAPPRWMFDNLLKTQANEPFLQNTMVKTRFSGNANNYTGTTYSLHSHKGILVPHLFSAQVPAPGGGLRPLADLLNNMLVIRGIDTGNAAHLGSAHLVSRPPGTDATTGGLIADKSHLPLPAIGLNITNLLNYRSKKGVSVIHHNTQLERNNIATLLSPFQENVPQAFKAKREAIDETLRDTINVLDRGLAYYADNIRIDSNNANSLLKNGFDDLEANWNQVYNKYKGIIDSSIQLNIPGITDRPIGVGQTRNNHYRRTIATGIVYNNDLRTVLQGATIRAMAENFAMTEFLLTRGYTQYMVFRLRGNVLENMNLQQANGSMIRGALTSDQHQTGSMLGLLANSIYFAALGACLLALQDALKNTPSSVSATPFNRPLTDGNLFDQTLIQYGAEFNRSPRQDGSGADHAAYATSFSMFSGSIEGPQIIGNIALDNNHSSYYGTFGRGAINPDMSRRPIGLGNLVATQAAILGVENPSPNNSSVVRASGNSIASLLRPGQIVRPEEV